MGRLKTYLIHWSPPIGNPQNPHGIASHYLGCTNKNLLERFQEHCQGQGQGAKITRGAILQGRTLLLVRYWNGGWRQEKIIKKRHNSRYYCPICNPKQLSIFDPNNRKQNYIERINFEVKRKSFNS